MKAFAISLFVLAIALAGIDSLTRSKKPLQNPEVTFQQMDAAIDETATAVKNTIPQKSPAGVSVEDRKSDIDAMKYQLHTKVATQKAAQTPSPAPAAPPGAPSNNSLLWIRVGISAVLLIAALYVILSKGDPAQKHWAYGAVGTILGFWLTGTP